MPLPRPECNSPCYRCNAPVTAVLGRPSAACRPHPRTPLAGALLGSHLRLVACDRAAALPRRGRAGEHLGTTDVAAVALDVTQPAAVDVDFVLAAVVEEHDRGTDRQQLLEVPGGPSPVALPALPGCGISGALILL